MRALLRLGRPKLSWEIGTVLYYETQQTIYIVDSEPYMCNKRLAVYVKYGPPSNPSTNGWVFLFEMSVEPGGPNLGTYFPELMP